MFFNAKLTKIVTATCNFRRVKTLMKLAYVEPYQCNVCFVTDSLPPPVEYKDIYYEI